jgi:hypothetical protein
MSMIVIAWSPDRIVLAGDRYRKLVSVGGVSPNWDRNGHKVILSANGRIAVAIAGDLVLLTGPEAGFPNLWFERSLQESSSESPQQEASRLIAELEAVTPQQRSMGGTIVIAGFDQTQPTVLLLKCKSKSDKDFRMKVDIEREIRAVPSTVGFMPICDHYPTPDDCLKAANLTQEELKRDQRVFAEGLINGISDKLERENRTGVCGPAESFFVERPE